MFQHTVQKLRVPPQEVGDKAEGYPRWDPVSIAGLEKHAEPCENLKVKNSQRSRIRPQMSSLCPCRPPYRVGIFCLIPGPPVSDPRVAEVHDCGDPLVGTLDNLGDPSSGRHHGGVGGVAKAAKFTG